MEVRYIFAMKMKLDDPSFISTPTAPAAPFSAEKNPAVLADAFTEAWRHASRPPADPNIPKPPALVWAGTTTAGLVARFNEHPEVRATKSVAAIYNGAVVLTDLRGPRPQFTEAQDQEVLALRKLPSHLLANTSDAYSVARQSGRLATWPSVKTAWDAAVARGDSNNQRVCAFAARAMDQMTRSFYPAPLPPPPRKQDLEPVFDEPDWRDTHAMKPAMMTTTEANESLRHPKSITREAFEVLNAAVVAREWDRVMALCAESFDGVVGSIWSNAMTMHLGHDAVSMRYAEEAITEIYLCQVERTAKENAAA